MNESTLTMGSLFDGSGGFPLAAFNNGVTPIWSSEIEPFPIRVTTKRFPYMKHYGDISKIDGSKIEPVNIITFGSPCQDLSVAGKRAGMKYVCPKCKNHFKITQDLLLCLHCKNPIEKTRSGLFVEAIRIIKEMREATNGQYPTFAVWENVTGAFSSHKGEDFQVVLEEFCSIIDNSLSVPRCSKKWLKAGSIVGDNFSIAWRTFDAQYWGVPQRRKRIYLVADFSSNRAESILFECDRLCGNSTESGEAGQGTSADTPKGFGEYDKDNGIVTLEPGIAKREGGHIYEGLSGTLRANAGDNAMAVAYALQKAMETEEEQTTVDFGRTADRIQVNAKKSVTIQADGGGLGAKTGLYLLPEAMCLQGSMIGREEKNGPQGDGINEEVSFTLNTVDRHATVYALDRASFNQGANALYNIDINDSGVNSTVVAKGPSAVCYNIGAYESNAMKSANPHSGIYETEITRTLDLNGGNPACNQGGTVICEPAAYGIDGYNGAVTGEKVSTLGVNCGISTGRQGVLQGTDTLIFDNSQITSPINGNNPHWNDASHGISRGNAYNATVILKNQSKSACDSKGKINWIVRRLIPLECSRLQGFPDWWVDGLEEENPTEEEMQFWRETFETHRKLVTNASKPKSDNQIRKWLKNPTASDGPLYKMWGNGIALPCADAVFYGIVKAVRNSGKIA